MLLCCCPNYWSRWSGCWVPPRYLMTWFIGKQRDAKVWAISEVKCVAHIITNAHTHTDPQASKQSSKQVGQAAVVALAANTFDISRLTQTTVSTTDRHRGTLGTQALGHGEAPWRSLCARLWALCSVCWGLPGSSLPQEWTPGARRTSTTIQWRPSTPTQACGGAAWGRPRASPNVGRISPFWVCQVMWGQQSPPTF